MRYYLYGFLLLALIGSTGWVLFGTACSVPAESTGVTEAVPVLKNGQIVWHWEEAFSEEEKGKIQKWLTQVYRFTQGTLGTYPFDIHFHLYRSGSAKEPVPWANTVRGERQGVNFHVNPDFSLTDFLDDWTAPHEISHLSLPFVGSENMWFSEGYATYMQYRIMATQGVYTEAEIELKYRERIAKCKPNYQSNRPLPEVADSLLKRHEYPDLYWGGVSYFWNLDKALQKEHHISLTDLVKKYESCCREDSGTPKSITKAWDRLVNDAIATQLLHNYTTQPARQWFEEFDW